LVCSVGKKKVFRLADYKFKEDPFLLLGGDKNVLSLKKKKRREKKKIFKQLLTMDTSVPKSIKTAAKCDISCELQNSVNH